VPNKIHYSLPASRQEAPTLKSTIPAEFSKTAPSTASGAEKSAPASSNAAEISESAEPTFAPPSYGTELADISSLVSVSSGIIEL
jgi:hypothetical protein